MHCKTFLQFATRAVAGAVAFGALAAPAAAQTVRLTQSNATVLRGGSHANTNLSSDPVLATRASNDDDERRRVLLKFDTHNTIPVNTPIAWATLTLTIAGGDGAPRTVVPYRVPFPYDVTRATWNRRKKSISWARGGGDAAEPYPAATVTDRVGSRATFDVTALIRGVVSGKFGPLRYSRILLVDTGAASRESFKEYYSDEAADPSVRPVLTVTYGRRSSPPASVPDRTPNPRDGDDGRGEPDDRDDRDDADDSPEGNASTLRVLHWNTHHGGRGTDGRYDPARIAALIAKINPEVVSLNEVDNRAQVDAIVSRVNAATGITWKTAYSGWGNLIMTRLRVDNTSVCVFNPGAGRKAAHLSTVVNGRRINLWSAHLAVDSARARLSEVDALQKCARSWSEASIIAGDYNMQASSAEYAAMTRSYKDAWIEAKRLGKTTNYSGNCDGCTRKSRIDYVFTSKGATALSVKSARIYDSRDSRGVLPSDHKPMLVTYTVK